MNQHLKNLKCIGLNSNQAKVYLAALEMGQTSVIELAKKTHLNRTAIYDYIIVLKEYGLINEIVSQGKRLFIAEHPGKLNNIVDIKKQKIQESLPELLSLFKTAKIKPGIQVFEGIQGISKIIELSIIHNHEKKRYIFGDLNTLFSWIPEPQMQSFINLRIKKAIRNYTIAANSLEEVHKFSHYDEQKHKKELREIRLMPKGFNFPFQFYAYDDNIALISSTQEGYSILIKSLEFSTAFKSLFKFIWEMSQEV